MYNEPCIDLYVETYTVNNITFFKDLNTVVHINTIGGKDIGLKYSIVPRKLQINYKKK